MGSRPILLGFMKSHSPKSRWRKRLLGLGLGALVLVVALALVLMNAVVEIPKPSGPHPVGFRSVATVDPSRTLTVRGQTLPRVVTLDTWYPAAQVNGLVAEPYQDKQLGQLLAKYQHFPEVGSGKPSHSYIGAPVLPGKHPVILFNHGYGSYTKQNFSNMQELASQGYLVISLGHPTESLLSKDAQGRALEFNPDSPAYVELLRAQENPKALLEKLSAVLARQRGAVDLTTHLRASQELATVPPFSGLRGMLQDWVQDTRWVIQHLGEMPEADATRIVLMGHSFGGVTSMEVAKEPPPGVVGVVDLDGPWVTYGEDVRPLRVPLLALLSTQNRVQGQDIGMHGTLDAVLKEGVQPAHVIEIAGTAHLNFTDLTYVQLLKYITPALGEVDVQTVVRFQNEATRTFLERLAGGDLRAPLLAPDPRVSQRAFAGRP